MSLPTYGTLRRLQPLLLIVAARVVLKRALPSPRMLVAVGAVVLGSALATTYEWDFDFWSILYACIHLGLSTAYMTLLERLVINKGYSLLDILYMNSFNNLVFFLIADMIQDEIRDAFMSLPSPSLPSPPVPSQLLPSLSRYFLTSSSLLFWWCLVGVLALGIVMNISYFALIIYQGSLEVSIINAAKVSLSPSPLFLSPFSATLLSR